MAVSVEHGLGEEDEDEGPDELDGLEDDTIEDGEEPPAYTAGLGTAGYGAAQAWDMQQPWDFGSVGRDPVARGSDDEAGDAASDTAANGSNAGDALSERMMEDFGDEIGLRPGNVSPAPSEEMPDLVGEMDPPVAEVRLGESEEERLE